MRPRSPAKHNSNSPRLASDGTFWVSMIRSIKIFMVGLAFGISASLGATAAADTNTFGFSGPEIFPVDNGISQLHVADFDMDGRNDILVVNNARSKINILYNQTGKTN